MPPAAWNNLPTEVLKTIFQLLNNQKDKKECELVCHKWKKPAQQALYSTIEVSAAQKLDRLIKCLRRGGRPATAGKYVENLCLSTRNKRTTAQQQQPKFENWNVLPTCFPLLRNLIMSDPNGDYYDTILSAYSDGKWPLLESIVQPKKDILLGLYTKCVIDYKDNLKAVLLSDKVSRDKEERNKLYTAQYKKLSSELAEFPRLKNLTVTKHSDESLETLDSLIEKCQSLETVTLGLSPAHSESYPVRSREAIDLSSVTPRPLIKSLTTTAVIDRDNTLLYIMHKFPNLNQLTINESYDVDYRINVYIALNSITTTFTAAVLTKFLDYLRKIPAHSIGYFYPGLGEISDALLEHWINFPDAEHSVNFEYQIHQGIFHVYSSISSSKLGTLLEIKNGVPTLVFKHLNGRQLPHIEIFDRGGDFINHLQINFGGDAYFSKNIIKYDSKKMDAGNSFDDIFYYCTNLKSLTIINGHFIRCNPDKMRKSKNTKHLKLSHVHLYAGLLEELAIRLPNLTRLTIDCCKFTDINGRLLSKQNYTMNMPNITLEYMVLTFQKGCRMSPTIMFELTSVASNNKKRYFVASYDEMESKYKLVRVADDKRFEKSLDNRACPTFSITCHSFSSFIVTVAEKTNNIK